MNRGLFQSKDDLVFLSAMFVFIAFSFPQAFATIDSPASINFVIVNPASIDVFCTDPVVSNGTAITGNTLDIDDSVLFDSIDITKSSLNCDGLTLNKISTGALTDLVNYNLRLTVFTSDSSNSTNSNIFLQPKSNAAILVFEHLTPGPKTIQFRDISVTDNLDPTIFVPSLPPNVNGTLIITDHNANADLNNMEKITAQINGIDVTLYETGINTGVFEHTFGAGDSVSYDPGTLGLSRATINLNFDSDSEGGSILVPFTSNEKHEDSGATPSFFDTFEVIYKDADSTANVTSGDIRLANAAMLGYSDGSVVIDGDYDAGLSLVSFNLDEKHEDSGATPSFFDKSETVYKDADNSANVTSGDIRLANIKTQGYFDGSRVSSDVFDGVGDIIIEDVMLDASQLSGSEGFSPITHPFSLTFANGGRVLNGTNVNVTMSYADFVPNNASLLQMYYQRPGLAYGLITASFDNASHNTVLKTVTSNPTLNIGFGPVYNDGFGLPLPTIQGNYVLGFDLGSGGGGAGGISRSGLVVQALGGLAILGGGLDTVGPPSFDSSSFAVKQDGNILSHDGNPKSTDSAKFEIGTDSTITVDFSLPGGLHELDHVGLYTNIEKGQGKDNSDTYVFYDAHKTPQVTVHDPNGFFQSADASVIEKDKRKLEMVFNLNFAKPMTKNNVVVEAWSNIRDSALVEVPNLITVTGSPEPELKQDVPQPIQQENQTAPIVPVWIKNNAGWWGQGQISDETFTNGIGFLIQKRIIDVPDLLQTNVSPDPTKPQLQEFNPVVPSWVKNTAQWWSEDKLTDDEFLRGIKYLLEKGIIQVRV